MIEQSNLGLQGVELEMSLNSTKNISRPFPPFISPQKLNVSSFIPTLLKSDLLTAFSFHIILKRDGHMSIMTSLRCHFCKESVFLRNFTSSSFLFV